MSPDTEVTTETENEPVVDTTAPPITQPRTRKGYIEANLKNLLMQEMSLRQQIKAAKTNAKKNYFKKKLSKIDIEAKKHIAALRRMEDPNE